MKITEFFRSKFTKKPLVIGWYGGGNYGDELLLEVVLNFLNKSGIKDAMFYYSNRKFLDMFHHRFGYTPVPPGLSIDTLKALLTSKNIIIGGGGIWGLDFNRNVLVMSFMLFVARWILFKNVHLIGIGYYGSTGKLGKLSAFLAAKAANTIIARDSETEKNFGKFSKRVSKDFDLSFYMDQLDLSVYEEETRSLVERLDSGDRKNILLWFRSAGEHDIENYKQVAQAVVSSNRDKLFTLCYSRPSSVYKKWGGFIEKLHNDNPDNTKLFDLDYNPVSLYLAMRRLPRKLLVVGPQFHVIAVAYLANVEFLPMVYDNKVYQLLEIVGKDASSSPTVGDLSAEYIQEFIDSRYK
jgi:polysaccharide pyruvyl transferase WcaK-like protein